MSGGVGCSPNFLFFFFFFLGGGGGNWREKCGDGMEGDRAGLGGWGRIG